MTDEDKDNLTFACDFRARFMKFRDIERQNIPEGLFNSGEAAFRLLSDLEVCYAARAYYACIILSFSMIEIYLEQVEGHDGRACQMIQSAGLEQEVDWLRKLRNDIIHGKPNETISYLLDEDGHREFDEKCQRAFRLLHALPKRMQRRD